MKRMLWMLAVLLAYAAPALGDGPNVEEARRLFNAGAEAFAVGQFTASAQAFSRSYELSPRPGTLFSLAQAERRQFYVDHDSEHLKRAIDALRRYVGGVEQGGRRTEAVDALSELEPLYDKVAGAGNRSALQPASPAPQATRLMVTSRAGSRIVVDGKLRSEAPFIRDIEPGRHRVEVQATGFFSETRDIEVKDLAFVVLDVTLRERPGTLDIRAPRGSEVYVDGVPRGTTPMVGPCLVTAGTHTISVVASGATPWTRTIRIDQGVTVHLAATLRTSPQRTAAWIATGVGGAGLAAAGAFAGLSLTREAQARAFLDTQANANVSPNDIRGYQSAQRARDSWRAASEYTAIGGVALLAVGGALFVFDRPSAPRDEQPAAEEPPAPQKRSIDPTLASVSGGWQVGLSGRF
jgi:hypothetical protein